ncbi:hypothetical protein [Methylobacterium sp. 37f]|uniref:hypothetical protein n=1 Tax=Methylobacterium sp. 37f TaxID=2817058 RepID=UPI001FFDC14B|nr:hypothetical protein [Methylobacterium sp. 37f]MCK2057168.1 hypothetical protein [Methylobacterium sp. 37f]
MRALLMRPHAELSSTDTDLLKSLLVTAAQAVEEAEMHERVSATAASDPMLAKAILLNEIEGTSVHDAHYPMARKRIADQLDVMIAAEQDASVLARRLVEARDAFRRSPGSYLPGSAPAEGVSFLNRAHDMDGWILVDGMTCPWVFASAGVGRMTVFEVSQYLAAAPGIERAYVVGSHIKEGVVLPDNIRFVELPIDAVALNAGMRA